MGGKFKKLEKNRAEEHSEKVKFHSGLFPVNEFH